MKSTVLSQFTMPWLTAMACLLFVGVFLGILIWTFRRGSKKVYEECGQIPLNEKPNQREKR